MYKCQYRYVLIVLSISITFEATQCKDIEGVQCGSYISYNVSTDDLGFNRYLPYHLALHRCQGDVGTFSPIRRKCVAATNDHINVTLKNSHTQVDTNVELLNETSCKSVCTYDKSSCSKLELFDGANCICDCPDYKKMGILEQICPSGGKKIWNSQMCSCDCKQKNTCTVLQDWDADSCECRCLSGMKEQCELMKAKFDEITCTCILYITNTEESGTSEENNTSISMNTFIMGLVLQSALLVIAAIIVLVVMQRRRSNRIANSLIQNQKHEPYTGIR